jgi:hypothetical protein
MNKIVLKLAVVENMVFLLNTIMILNKENKIFF